MEASPPTVGFLSALFDLSFANLITPRVIRFVYVILLVGGGVAAVAYTLFAFSVDGTYGLLVLLLGAPLAFLINAIFWRLVLELTIAIFKIAENTRGPIRVTGA